MQIRRQPTGAHANPEAAPWDPTGAHANPEAAPGRPCKSGGSPCESGGSPRAPMQIRRQPLGTPLAGDVRQRAHALAIALCVAELGLYGPRAGALRANATTAPRSLPPSAARCHPPRGRPGWLPRKRSLAAGVRQPRKRCIAAGVRQPRKRCIAAGVRQPRKRCRKPIYSTSTTTGPETQFKQPNGRFKCSAEYCVLSRVG